MSQSFGRTEEKELKSRSTQDEKTRYRPIRVVKVCSMVLSLVLHWRFPRDSVGRIPNVFL